MNKSRVTLRLPLAASGPVLTWNRSQLDELCERCLDIAERAGLQIEADEGDYPEQLKKLGVRVEGNTVYFTRAQLVDTLDVLRRCHPAGDPARRLTSPAGRDAQEVLVGNGANLVFDWEKWNVTPGDRFTLASLADWAQGNSDVTALFPPVMIQDVDMVLEPIYNYALLAGHCRKDFYHEQPTHPIHVEYLGKMAEVVRSHTGYFHPMQKYEFLNPPFKMGQRAIDTMLKRIDLGLCDEMGVGSMAVSGVSAPVTVTATAVTAVAETLCGLALFHTLRPQAGLDAFFATGSFDVRSSRIDFFGMHTHLQNVACWDIFVRGFGVDTELLTWYRDANEPGLQACYEFGMAQSFFSGLTGRCSPELGGLSNGNIFSPHQAVLDIELLKEYNELTAGFEGALSDTEAEEIVAAVTEPDIHLTSDTMIENMADNVAWNGLFQRGQSAGAGHTAKYGQTLDLLEHAGKQVAEDTARGKEQRPDGALAQELYGYVKEAAERLGVECPPLA